MLELENLKVGIDDVEAEVVSGPGVDVTRRGWESADAISPQVVEFA